jgi:hypothetical protein
MYWHWILDKLLAYEFYMHFEIKKYFKKVLYIKEPKWVVSLPKQYDIGHLSAHAFSQSHAFSQFARKCVGRPHTFSQIVRKCAIAKKCGLTLNWDDFSQLRENVWAPPTLSRNSRNLRKSVESPPYFFLKNIVSVFENGLFAFLTVNIEE